MSYPQDLSCKLFTIGGIIVDNTNRIYFKNAFDNIISTFFNFDLPTNFKLHYEELRNAHLRKQESVYKRFSNPMKRKIADYVFDAIKKIDCLLLSVTINLEKHYKKYTYPISPLSYALYLILERFPYFLEDINGR